MLSSRPSSPLGSSRRQPSPPCSGPQHPLPLILAPACPRQIQHLTPSDVYEMPVSPACHPPPQQLSSRRTTGGVSSISYLFHRSWTPPLAPLNSKARSTAGTLSTAWLSKYSLSSARNSFARNRDQSWLSTSSAARNANLREGSRWPE